MQPSNIWLGGVPMLYARLGKEKHLLPFPRMNHDASTCNLK